MELFWFEPNGWTRRENPLEREREREGQKKEGKTVKSAFSIFRNEKEKEEKVERKSLTQFFFGEMLLLWCAIAAASNKLDKLFFMTFFSAISERQKKVMSLKKLFFRVVVVVALKEFKQSIFKMFFLVFRSLENDFAKIYRGNRF